MYKFLHTCCAIGCLACSQTDSLVARSGPMQPQDASAFPVLAARISSADHAPLRAPDVPAAEAAEATILEQITRIFPPEAHDEVVAKLQRANEKIVSTANPRLSELLAQYYDARAHTSMERSRQRSVDMAHSRPRIPVVIALGALQPSERAVVLRRRLSTPPDVIILGQGADVDALAGAFSAMNDSRRLHGDDFTNALRIVVTGGHLTNAAPKDIVGLQQLLTSLHAASERNIDGLGTVKAIDSQTDRLTLTKLGYRTAPRLMTGASSVSFLLVRPGGRR